MRSLLRVSVAIVVIGFAREARADEPPPPRGLVLVTQVLFGRSVSAIGSGREWALSGLPDLRHPQWWGPDPPKPPALHVRFLRITF